MKVIYSIERHRHFMISILFFFSFLLLTKKSHNLGNEYVQSNMDLQTLKKRLNDDPKGIILELANGVANGGSAKNT